MELDPKILTEAEALYDSRLAYHNFEHVRYVLAAAENIVAKCQRENVSLDENVVYYATLFHDAGFIEDHASKGYKTKEAYSADLAAQILRKHNIDETTTQRVKQAILCTQCDTPCETNEDIAVRAADLSGLADDYEVFKDNASKLKDEYELLNNKSISWDDWKALVVKTLGLFLRQQLYLTSDYYDAEGDSVFHKTTQQNIDRLIADQNLD